MTISITLGNGDCLLDGLVFPEGPRWHAGRLWFSDIWGHTVYVEESGALRAMAKMEYPSGIGFLPDGRVLVAPMRSLSLMELQKGQARVFAELGAFGNAGLNDMVVDGAGRIYVDVNSASKNGTYADAIALVSPNGEARCVATGLSRPNGLAVTPDLKTLIVAEVRREQLTAFDIATDGSLSGRRCFARLGAKPDGICLDAGGGVWVGLFEEGRFIRVLEGGAVTDSVEIPGQWCIAPMLGGHDRRTLFLCAAKTTMEDLIQRGRSTGAIYSIQVKVPGAGWPG